MSIRKLVFLGVLLVSPSVYASDNFDGVGVGLGFDTSKNDNLLVCRINARALSITPLEIDFTYYLGRGVSTQFNLYLIHTKWVKWHFGDLGVYIPLGTKVFNSPEITRDYDVVAGTGLEVKLWQGLVGYVISRWYFPDPVKVVRTLQDKQIKGEFGEQTYDTAVEVKKILTSTGYDWHLLVGLSWIF